MAFKMTMATGTLHAQSNLSTNVPLMSNASKRISAVSVNGQGSLTGGDEDRFPAASDSQEDKAREESDTEPSQSVIAPKAEQLLEEESRKARCEKYMGLLSGLRKNGVISEHTREKLSIGILEEDEDSYRAIDEKTLVMKQIAKVKSRMAASAANHEGYLQKLPQTIIGPGSKQRRNFKQSGVWKRRFFVLKPESFQLVYFENHKSSVFHHMSDKDALGEMDLENGYHFVDVLTTANHPKSCQLVLGTRLLALRADSEAEMDMWLEAFAAIRTQWQQRKREQTGLDQQQMTPTRE